MDSWIAFMATTQGRDKFYRTIQYFTRFLGYYLGKVGGVETAKRLSMLSLAVGSGRKLFRVGKPLDHLYTILKALDQKGNDHVKYLTIGRATGFGCWLLLDTLQWINSIGFFKLSGGVERAVNTNAPRFWALGLLSSLLLNLTKMQQWHLQAGIKQKCKEKGWVEEGKLIFEDERGRRVALDCLQDTVDLVIPLSMMGVLEASPGTVGLAGTFTSILGAIALWPSRK